MLHVIITSHTPLGRIEELSLIQEEGGRPWYVDRVVVSDPVSQEVEVFVQSARVEGSHVWRSTPHMERNAWRENIFLQLLRELPSRLPLILTIFPAQVRTLKLDRTMSYVLGLAAWALVWQLAFSSDAAPGPGPCGVPQVSTNAIFSPTFYIEVIANVLIILVASVVSEGVVSVSLKRGERRPLGNRGLLPLPCWVRMAIRALACLAGAAFLSYSVFVYITRPPYYIAFSQLGIALIIGFAIQVATLAVATFVSVLARAWYHRPRWNYSFQEQLVNPEGFQPRPPSLATGK